MEHAAARRMEILWVTSCSSSASRFLRFPRDAESQVWQPEDNEHATRVLLLAIFAVLFVYLGRR